MRVAAMAEAAFRERLHAQIRLTADLYGHAYMDAKREVVSKMDGLFDTVAPSITSIKAT
jgi:hypothetical protein